MENYPSELRRDSNTIITLETTRLLLAFKQPHTFEDLAPVLQHLGIAFEEGERDENAPFPRQSINHTDCRFWIRRISGEAIDDGIYDSIEQTFGEQLDWIGPVYRLADTSGLDGLFCPLPTVLLIKTKQDDQAALSRMAVELGLREDSNKSEALIGFQYFVIDNPNDNDSYQSQRQIVDSGLYIVEEVLHENMPMVVPYSMFPVDELYGSQWSMVQIQAGADNPGSVTGWDLRRGASNIIIAILDSGCDLTHPDLQFSSQGLAGTLLGTGAHNSSTVDFTVGHGTAVAGIAAASINNLKGICGVAGGCLIWPFAFVNSTDVEVAYGIKFAVTMGRARVINMSFNSTTWNHTIINPSIELAYSRNVIMCASTGNQDGAIRYPSTHPYVIACGASDRSDNRAQGLWWGSSNFGSGISVVAPGVNIMTTDVQGVDGLNPGGDYTDFSGTSAAVPHVSGLAALLLSEDPTLSSTDVRNIIEQTADKVGAEPYIQNPFGLNGSWNRFMGHGRINVLRALQVARAHREQRSGRDNIDMAIPPTPEGFVPDSFMHLERLNKGLIEHEAALDRLDKKRTQIEIQIALHQTLLCLGRDVGIIKLINDMYENAGLIEELRNDSNSVLRLRGITLPEGVSISFIDGPRHAIRADFSVNGAEFFAQWSPELGFSSGTM